MFADAIERVSKYTRPIKFIMRNFGSSEIIPGTATLFFINENGVAVTCKHVAEELLKCAQINGMYAQYRSEISSLSPEAKPDESKSIVSKFGYTPLHTAQSKSMFFDCVESDNNSINYSVIKHPKYDLAIIIINNAKTNMYSDYAVFAKDSSKLRRGNFLCRYGYPFAEFSDYKYDSESDDIIWTGSDRVDTPPFPIEGMYTRGVVDAEGNMFEYELSTPGLRGQSGGPLFDSRGIVYGMQSETTFLHLGFDQEKTKVRINGQITEVDNHPFLHVGRCITVDVIKDFLNQNGVKYYIGDSLEQVECVNGGKESDTSCSEHPQSPRNTPSGIVRFISWIKGHRCRK